MQITIDYIGKKVTLFVFHRKRIQNICGFTRRGDSLDVDDYRIMSGSPSSTPKIEEFLTPRENNTYLHHVIQNESGCIGGTRPSAAVAEEVETIEKIAEMISNARRESPERDLNLSECCPKTKKQRQVLISQKLENDLGNAKSAGFQLENVEEAINLSTNAPAIVNTDEKCPLEEVEMKLEEMFAGIEDEQTTVTSKEQAPQPITCLASTSNCELNAIKDKIIPTKAAIKLAESIPFSLQSNVSDEIVDCTVVKSLPPRRRLSMAMQSPLLLEKHKIVQSKDKYVMDKDDSVVMNNNNTGARTNKDASNHTNMMPKKNKSFGNKRKGFSDNKKGRLQNVKHKKKPVAKIEEVASAKVKALKFKNRRSQNSSSSDSENDQDERAQQTIDAKYRSPYVLIKNNGTISVVNTTTTDESSDKNNKIKRTSIYVPERRNVRGIYSSTLSNKYDADTADSTWICVFCKRGPHKKGLGDLFGPYIINIDNEEFKTSPDMREKHLTSTSSKRRRIDVPHNNTSPSTVGQRKCSEVEGTPTAHAHEPTNDISESSSQHFLSGMSRMSSNTFEIWFHEDCAVWAPNLYIVGSRLVGLDSAIWQSTFHACVCCLGSGAIICCLQRDCKETAHLPCARENNWSLDESKFWAYCAKHHSAKFGGASIQNQLMRDRIKLSC